MKRLNRKKAALFLYAALLLIFGVFKFYGGIKLVIHTIRDNWFYVKNFDRIGFIPMNLIPGQTISRYIKALPGEIAIVNLFGNIAMFAPLGFLLAYAYPRLQSIKRFLITAGIITICCEILQLITFTGTLDIDDCILAMCGCLIGYVVYVVFNRKDA